MLGDRLSLVNGTKFTKWPGNIPLYNIGSSSAFSNLFILEFAKNLPS